MKPWTARQTAVEGSRRASTAARERQRRGRCDAAAKRGLRRGLATASALEPIYWCIHARREQQAGFDALLGGRITSSVADSPPSAGLLASIAPSVPTLHPIPSPPHPRCIERPRRLPPPDVAAHPRVLHQPSTSALQSLAASDLLLHPPGTGLAAAHGVASARPNRQRAVLMFRDPRGSGEEERSERFTRDRMQPGEPAYQRPTTQTPLSTARPLPSPTTPSAHPQPFTHHSPHQHRPPTSPRQPDQLPPLSTALYTAPKSSYYDPTSDHGLGQPHGPPPARYESHLPSQVPIPIPKPSPNPPVHRRKPSPGTPAAVPI